MSVSQFDPAALEKKLDANFDRIFGQLTSITNRLNSHDSRLARVETGKPDAGKGVDGEDGHGGEDDAVADAWTAFCDRTLRERERFARDFDSHDRDASDYRASDREFGGRGFRGYEDRGPRGFNDRGTRGYENRGPHGFEERGPRGYDDSGARGYDFDDRGFRGYDDRGGRGDGRGARDYDRGGGRFFDRHREQHRPPKIPFPAFNGETDPLTWLNKCDNFFRGHRVPEDEKVWMASLHLDGTTAEWYY